MKSAGKSYTVFVSLLLFMDFSLQQALLAGPSQQHLISPEELRHRVTAKASQRAEDIREVQTLLR